MFRHLITSINIPKLIRMQANQKAFIPGKNIARDIRIENRRYSAQARQIVQRKTKSKVKTYGKSKFYKSDFEK